MMRDEFLLPSGTTYFDGNSLGPLTVRARDAVLRCLGEWESSAVLGWEAWRPLSESLSIGIARLVGALPHEVIATGSITSNLHSLLATFHRPTGVRRHLLATSLDFPSDRQALDSWAALHHVEVRLVESRDGHTLRHEDLVAAMTDDVALALFPSVLYRSGQLLDVSVLTHEAQSRGLMIGWDLAHGIGAVPCSLHESGADFAVWCHYKYVNGGPGAPGGLFVHEKHHDTLPALRGWWGNDRATQFQMDAAFVRAPGAPAFQLGTPPVLSLVALQGALALWDDISIEQIRARSLSLTDHLIALCDRDLPELHLATPRAHAERGGHVALSHPHARALSAALRKRRIIPDFRAPDVLRLAPVALYCDEADNETLVKALREILDEGAFEDVSKPGDVT